MILASRKLTFVLSFLISLSAFSQSTFTVATGERIEGRLVKISKPFSETKNDETGEIVKFPKPGVHIKNDWPLHDRVNPNALPQGMDPALQKNYSPATNYKNLIQDFAGIGNTNVDPSDPSLDVGPNHIVQMINAGSGSQYEIWDKSNGNSLLGPKYLDADTGVPGAGDPIVIYDQIADRWLLSEFANTGNKLVIAVSQSPDPTGSYYIYEFTTPNFPDYPKYGLWTDSYIVTTNENNQRIYALERDKMLLGDPTASMQQFNLVNFPTIGFQAATPVNFYGTTNPPANSPGIIMRMADDAWANNIPADRLEIYELDIDWNNANNSTLSGPTNLTTLPFDTELCGYTSFSCIEQPSGPNLDPLREVLMNKIMYRNFGSHESIVCCHVTDVDGNDLAGVRWYELRNTGSGWSIFQQGTYSPDGHNRWMGSIGINGDGAIGLTYNISSTSIYPGIRYTGRSACDPLGTMTWAETVIEAGSAANSSNRYGDYNTMTVDPGDESFWMTAQYNPSSSWSTRIGQFDIPSTCDSIELTIVNPDITACDPQSAIFNYDLNYLNGFTGTTTFTTSGLPGSLTEVFSNNPVSSGGSYSLTLSNISSVSSGIYPFTLTATSGTETSELDLSLIVEEDIVAAPVLQSPANGANNQSVNPTLSWNAAANSIEYELDLASDAAFNSIIESVTTPSLSHIVQTSLSNNTQYFWRVNGTNSCGDGPLSSTFDFTTSDISCLTKVSTDVPVNIPSNGTPTVTSTLTISETGTINEINEFDLDITHSWIADLSVSITSPNGTTVSLLDNICAAQNNILITHDDSGAPYNTIPCPPNGGTYKSDELLSAFIGEQVNGTWTLTVSDNTNNDGGSIDAWGFEYCITGGGCPPEYSVSNGNALVGTQSSSADFETDGILESSQTITGGPVDYDSGTSILLMPGFEISLGVLFEAFIDGCGGAQAQEEILEKDN